MLIRKGFARSVVAEPRLPVRLREQCPVEPPHLAPEEVDPCCALHETSFCCAEGQSPVGETCFSPWTDMLFAYLPRRGDGHEIVRRAHEASSLIPPLFPGWSLGVTVRSCPVDEPFHTIHGPVRQKG